MGSINLTILEQTSTQIQTASGQSLTPTVQYTYSDVFLDLKPQTADTKVSYDLEAIKNSIENLFNSMPGQWVLNPTLGIGLQQFLFYPVNQTTGELIAETIIQNLTNYDPRVSIQKINIVGDPDQNLYEVTLALLLPNLNNTNVTLQGTLNDGGFQFTA